MARHTEIIVFLVSFLLLVPLSVVLLSQPIHEGADENPPRQTKTEKDAAEMILIPAGPFKMGIDSATLQRVFEYDGVRPPQFETEVREESERQVNLPSYYIDKYEVTNEQYEKFVRETDYEKPKYWKDPIWGAPKKPVVGITYEDARAYAKWAGKRLPTEAEWEKAAKGTEERWWPWGSRFVPGYCNSGELKIGTTTRVGQFPRGASPYGVHDMAGNVWEMCEGPWTNSSGQILHNNVMRGGCFISRDTFVRTTVRWSPAEPAAWLGFRCVMQVR